MTGECPGFVDPPDWQGPSSDPNDRQFGDAIDAVTVETADAVDVVLVGEPYDGAVIGRRGAGEGPAAIRDSLAATKTHHVRLGPVCHSYRETPATNEPRQHGPDGPLAIGDLGNVRLPDGDPSVASVQARVQQQTAPVHDLEALPIFVGGDNSLTVPNVGPLLPGDGDADGDGDGDGEDSDVGVLSFDAHLDCRALHDGPTSGTPYRQLFDRGLASLAVVGARDFETSTAYHDYLHERGGHVTPAPAVASDPAGAVDDALAALGDVPAVYVSLDMDVLDAVAAPGVSAPTPGGLSTRSLFAALERAGAHGRVVGFEVLECAPPRDEHGRTVDAAARAIAHFLAGVAHRDAARSSRAVHVHE